MNNQLDLLILAEGNTGMAQRYRCDGKQRVDVRDLSTLAAIQIFAEEISIYRHTLLMNGMAYRILNVFKPA